MAGDIAFEAQIVFWLWLTVLFGNFAEALAEGRGKAQAASLRSTKAELKGNRIKGGTQLIVAASDLRAGDIVLVETGEQIPADGEVIEGVASVNEAAITGESAPVIREAGGDRSAVTAGTRVISDWIKVRVTVEPGEGFLDRMISLVEGASRAKTPERGGAHGAADRPHSDFPDRRWHLASLRRLCGWVYSGADPCGFVRGADPNDDLCFALGHRDRGHGSADRFNVLAKSGRAVEAAGDIDTLLLDKTGTITLGDRQATEFLPLPGVTEADLVDAARLA